ncbi:hypothetical protein [Thermococcus sp. JdF3]|uniref:hypothetical protein n=1 Tax=Thermococcus sp. JdF3 TaxID=1638258 RepID=UPI001439F12F|nr:hypothetical protein [Thermococcus sp. JdF3]NJE01836.1 hypothetical protein [Thermococcus sp. JdF3]
MAVPAVIAFKERDNIIQLAMYAFLAIAVLYTLYKLFGVFKEVGEKVENFMNNLKNDLEQAPEKFTQTGKDLATIVKGTLTGKQNTGEYNEAMTRLHYGGSEWKPGGGGKINRKTGTIRKYGTPVRPGQEVLFDGEWYANRFVNNLVKSPDSNEYVSREDALARKYGFSTYAQFNAWLSGVKAALKAAGKDPSQMSLDQIVKYGRELERKKEEWKKTHKATARLEPHKDVKRPWLKPLPLEKQDELLNKLHPRTPIGGSLPARGLIPIGDGKCLDVRTGKRVPCPKLPVRNFPKSREILPAPHPKPILDQPKRVLPVRIPVHMR